MRNVEMPPASTLTRDQDWPVVAASGICLMFSVGTLLLYSFGVFVHPLVAEFHWTRTQVSGALSAGQFTIGLSAPVWGMLLDRFGPRRVILPSVVFLSLIFGSLAMLTPHLWQLYLTFVLFTLLGGGAGPVGHTAILVRLFERRLGLALGLALMGIGFGAAFLPSVAQACVTAFGWRSAYAIMGLMTLVVTFPATLFATRKARVPAASPRNHKGAPILSMVLTPAFILLSTILVILGVTSGGTLSHLVPMMIDRGFTPAAAARVAGLAGIAVIVGRGGIGWLLDRWNAARLLAGVALVVMVSLLLLVYGRGNVSSYVAAFLVGSVLGAEVDFTAFLVRRYFGQAAFARLFGIAFGLFVAGTGVGPLLLGMSFDRLGGYKSGLLLFVGISAIAGAATFAMPNYDMQGPTPLTEPVH
jgi:nitrate/nitrite transporter NarK